MGVMALGRLQPRWLEVPCTMPWFLQPAQVRDDLCGSAPYGHGLWAPKLIYPWVCWILVMRSGNLTASIHSQVYSPSPLALSEQSLWQPSHVDIATHSEDAAVSSPVCAGCCFSQSLPVVLAKLPCRTKRTGGSPLVSQEGTTRIRRIHTSFHLGILGDLGSSLSLFFFVWKRLACNQYPFV